MSPIPVIVSFYTIGTEYADEAKAMERTARDFGLKTDVRGVPDLGDWTLNCGQKPAFIRDRMLDYEGRPVVWLDADARIRRSPVLFGALSCDFAAHWRWGKELLSGTMYFGGGKRAWALVQAWCEAQKREPMAWDQMTLQGVIENQEIPNLSVNSLPAEYTAIFDAGMSDDPIISHFQASRRLAKKVKGPT